MAELDVRVRWRRWVEKDIGGAEDRIAAVTRAAVSAIERGNSTEEAVAVAHQAAASWDERRSSVPDTRYRTAHSASASPASPPSSEFGGILEVVAADKSDLGRATLAALKAVDMHVSMRPKSFLATRGFRGRYGFQGNLSHRMWWLPPALLLLFLILIHFDRGIFGIIRSNQLQANFTSTLLVSIGVYFLIYLIFIIISSSILAHRAKIDIEKGRLLITYGFFSTRQTPIELHWIREVSWSQTFVQKLLNEATLWIQWDTPNRGLDTRIIPGLVQVNEMQLLVDKLRNAAQKLRQGNYYARSFIG